MDPLLDEKIILSVSQILPEKLEALVRVRAMREAFGPSKNEGICFEHCTEIGFYGDLQGIVYLGLDGYTKLKLLPRMAKTEVPNSENKPLSESIVLSFAKKLGEELLQEMKLGRFRIEMREPIDRSHKLVPFDLKRYRQYILIFFLRDDREELYLGRLTLVLLLEKFGTIV